MSKISIRFFNDREVRAIWDEANSKWWFSVLDIVGVLNAQDDYTKNRNYWKYLKTKLKKEESQLVSVTNQLKMTAADGKRYLTDVLDYDGVVLFAKSFSIQSSTFVSGIYCKYWSIFLQDSSDFPKLRFFVRRNLTCSLTPFLFEYQQVVNREVDNSRKAHGHKIANDNIPSEESFYQQKDSQSEQENS